jgi:hypothetical protein
LPFLSQVFGRHDLGKQVAEAAKEAKVPHEVRYVSNPTYTGNVMLYPKSFLDDYFKEQ